MSDSYTVNILLPEVERILEKLTALKGVIGQSGLFSPFIADLIDENHIGNPVAAVVACIDVSGVEKRYRSGPGNPAYARCTI